MRYVPIGSLKDGMILARNLYSKDQSLLLSQGQAIKDSYIMKLKRHGYSGVFIYDSVSDDIEIESLISDQLRMSAVAAVKDVFIMSAGGDANVNDQLLDTTKKIVNDLIDEILFNRDVMVNMVDLKIFDDYTFYHSVNVAVLSLLVGISLDFPRSYLYSLGLGALLHDIGKIFIDQNILRKNGPLSGSEFGLIKQHPSNGYEYLINHFNIPAKSYLGALQHHERYDGSGYPLALKGDRISEIGRIIAIADVYDALTSDRPYRKALLPSDAMEYIMGGAGTMFDPLYVSKFTHKVAAYPLGTIVVLSNGLRGIVVKNYEDCSTRPRIRVISEDSPDNGRYIDLRDDYETTSLTIVEVERD